jgi:multidrug efflux pump subunit AcrA (membrane-fusion protein)
VAPLGSGCGQGAHDDVDEAGGTAPSRVQRDGSLLLSQAEQRALGIVVAKAEWAELGDVSLRFGRVEARPGDIGAVVAPVTGRLAGEPAVTLGERLEAGALVVEFVPMLAAAEQVAASVRGAELGGQIDALERELGARRSELERAQELAASQIVSAAKLQEQRASVDATRAQLEALRRARGIQTHAQGRKLPLFAPIAGTVAMLDAPRGALLEAGTVLARIVAGGPLFVDVEVDPLEPPGDRYTVEVGGRWLAARMIAPGAQVSADGFRRDRLQLEGADALVPGAIVRIRVGHATTAGVVIPDSALVRETTGPVVFVEIAAGRYLRRPVELGPQSDGRARIDKGLSKDESIVVRGAQALRGESLRPLLQEQD